MQQKKDDFQKVWSKIVAKAWSDPHFKKKLKENPQEVLKTQGIDLPQGKRCVIQENTKDTLYLTLPEIPSGELSEKKLQEIAAGGSLYTHT